MSELRVCERCGKQVLAHNWELHVDSQRCDIEYAKRKMRNEDYVHVDGEIAVELEHEYGIEIQYGAIMTGARGAVVGAHAPYWAAQLVRSHHLIGIHKPVMQHCLKDEVFRDALLTVIDIQTEINRARKTGGQFTPKTAVEQFLEEHGVIEPRKKAKFKFPKGLKVKP